MSKSDPICSICNEPLSAHVPTHHGAYTHPREARGEGRYVLMREAYTLGARFPGEDDAEMPPLYRFVPAAKLESPYGHGWSPYP